MNENHTYNRIALHVWFCFCPFFVICVFVTCFLLFQSAIMANNPSGPRTAGVPTRSTANTWVIGASAKDGPPNRLPTLHQVLVVFFYEHKVCNRRERESAETTLDRVLVRWGQGNVPTVDSRNAVKKLLASVERYRKLLKNGTRTT